jgi:hypothetical protein
LGVGANVWSSHKKHRTRHVLKYRFCLTLDNLEISHISHRPLGRPDRLSRAVRIQPRRRERPKFAIIAPNGRRKIQKFGSLVIRRTPSGLTAVGGAPGNPRPPNPPDGHGVLVSVEPGAWPPVLRMGPMWWIQCCRLPRARGGRNKGQKALLGRAEFEFLDERCRNSP